MKALRKKEGKRPWHQTAIYRRRYKRFCFFRSVMMGGAVAAAQTKVSQLKFAAAPRHVVASAIIDASQSAVKAAKHAEKWRPKNEINQGVN